jgi:DNA-binding CsgD family transcriptional regulator
MVAAWRGDSREATHLAGVCIREANARGQGALVNYAHYALAVLENGQGHYEAAFTAAVAAGGDDVLGITGQALAELVEAGARCNESNAASTALAGLRSKVRASSTSWGLGVLARCQALTAEESEAESLYLESIAHLQRCRVTPQLARTRLVYGEWLRRQRRRREAREQLHLSEIMFVAMGAASFARRARSELLATSEHASRRGSAATESLTPRELCVAKLASTGMSNGDIALELYISTRTVEYHLHKTFRKLGIATRTQLALSLPADVR